MNRKIYNSALPITLMPINKFTHNKYEIALGNTTMLTTCNVDLKLNTPYWAQMSQNDANQIVINNLKPKPRILEIAKNSPLKLSLDDFIEFINSSENPMISMRDFLREIELDLPYIAEGLRDGVLVVPLSSPSPAMLQVAFEPLRIFGIFERFGIVYLHIADRLYFSAHYPSVLSLARRYFRISDLEINYILLDDIPPLTPYE